MAAGLVLIMEQWNTRQKQLAAESLGNLAVAVVTVGGVSPLFDPKYQLNILFLQFMLSLAAGFILFVFSFSILKK